MLIKVLLILAVTASFSNAKRSDLIDFFVDNEDKVDDSFDESDDNKSLEDTLVNLNNKDNDISTEKVKEFEAILEQADNSNKSEVIKELDSDSDNNTALSGIKLPKQKVRDALNKTLTNIKSKLKESAEKWRQWVKNYKCSNSSSLVKCTTGSRLLKSPHSWSANASQVPIPLAQPAPSASDAGDHLTVQIDTSVDKALRKMYKAISEAHNNIATDGELGIDEAENSNKSEVIKELDSNSDNNTVLSGIKLPKQKVRDALNKTLTNIKTKLEEAAEKWRQWVKNYKCSNSSSLVKCTTGSRLLKSPHSWSADASQVPIPLAQPAPSASDAGDHLTVQIDTSVDEALRKMSKAISEADNNIATDGEPGTDGE